MSKRILVVEDQPDNRQIIRDMLAPTDYEITEAENVSDEFVDVMLGKIIEALKPNPFDQLDEATLNSALGIIDSARCSRNWKP
jgi:CheY-like chemotaxis protein